MSSSSSATVGVSVMVLPQGCSLSNRPLYWALPGAGAMLVLGVLENRPPRRAMLRTKSWNHDGEEVAASGADRGAGGAVGGGRRRRAGGSGRRGRWALPAGLCGLHVRDAAVRAWFLLRQLPAAVLRHPPGRSTAGNRRRAAV